MSAENPQQLPPTQAISLPNSSRSPDDWFVYPVRVYPHQTDYAGVVWHGNYITWMEEARVEYLRSVGVVYEDLIALGCELPVVELSIRYHRALQLGTEAVLKSRISEASGVRISWDYLLESTDGQELYLSATTVLVPIDRDRGKIMRQLPPNIKDALAKITNNFGK